MVAVHLIVVTHNSEQILPRCLTGIIRQLKQPVTCIVVDSGSDFPENHRKICRESGVVTEFLAGENHGFAVANNRGFSQLLTKGMGAEDIVVFVNPDTFMQEDNLKKIVDIFVNFSRVGAVSGTLLGYDLHRDQPSGFVDSTGIFRRWYGRWYDRDQGKKEHSRLCNEEVPALCGAFFACRGAALLQLAEDGQVFDERFFLYKEDIELSLTLRRGGWQLLYCPEIRAFHCRGWAQQRKKMEYNLRLMAAKNEIFLYQKHPSPYICWAFFKYLLVRYLRV